MHAMTRSHFYPLGKTLSLPVVKLKPLYVASALKMLGASNELSTVKDSPFKMIQTQTQKPYTNQLSVMRFIVFKYAFLDLHIKLFI